MPEAAPTPTTSGPDAKVLAMLAEFDAPELQHLEIMVRPCDTAALQPELDASAAAQDALNDRTYDLRATTLEGCRAQTCVLARHEPASLRPVKGETDSVEWMVAALLRDLIAEAPMEAPESVCAFRTSCSCQPLGPRRAVSRLGR